MWLLIILGLATATLSLTLSRAKIGAPVRSWAEYKAPWLAYLASCPFCLSYWFSCLLVLSVNQFQVSWVVDTLAVVALSSLFSLPLLHFMFAGHEVEQSDKLHNLYRTLHAARDKIEDLQSQLEQRVARAHQEAS